MKLAIVGEAWGAEEAKVRMPFVGASGYLLDQLLKSAGIARHECLITNVFNLKPEPTSDIANLCGPKCDSDLPAISTGKYLRREFYGELERLANELNAARPNLVLALGGTALWAFTGVSAISKNRGAVLRSTGAIHAALSGYKILPTFHPAAIFRDYSLLPIAYADFAKAAREREFPEIIRPQRRIYIEPSISDLDQFLIRWRDAKFLAIDIETRGDAITCIGFAPTTTEALVIPFEDLRKQGGSYWPTPFQEKQALARVRNFCQLPARKVFQNGLYDLHFLWRRYGITVANPSDDTMLLHHALQPESPKGLAFLGSIYTNEASWKLMRTQTIKKEG
jgi:DNA polymerase